MRSDLPFPRVPNARTRRARVFGVFIAVLGLSACGLLEPEIADDGTIEFLDIEGGCWIIQTESEQYLPRNLPEEFRVDGLAIQFEASTQVSGASFCPGRIIDLSWIDYLEDG